MEPARNRARARSRAGLSFAALAAALLTGCASPGWYAQAAAGHLELMRGREDLAGVIADPQSDSALAEQLATAAAIRDFAADTLGLPVGDSYTRFVQTGRGAVTWNVVAAPEFSLEPRRWCFPFAGCVPYLGWFDADRARRHADRLAARGLDVAVAPAAAYSTLGWFDDPLTDTLLDAGEVQLAAYLFHELAHRQLWLAQDPEFSESYASFVEDVAVETWLQASGRAGRLGDWRRRQVEAAAFDRLLGETRASLAALYAGDGPPERLRALKAEAFRALERRYRDTVEREWNGRDPYAHWFDEAPNNARLALNASYRGGRCAFEALYREAGADFRRFAELARQRASLAAAERRAWLEQPCQVIAP